MHALLDLVLPARCAGCGVAGRVICVDCTWRFAAPARLAMPSPSPAGLPATYAVTAYAGPARDVVLAYKEEGVVGLQRVLGGALARAVAAALGASTPDCRAPVWLMPVPSTKAARRARGDDVVARLARVATRVLRQAGYDARVVAALRHGRRVRDSSGLSATERAGNLAGAFRVSPRLPGQAGPIVLVDDLVTTGATLAECAAAVREAGLLPIGAATVCATQRTKQPR